MAKKAEARRAVQPEPESDPTYEPMEPDHFDPAEVVVDVVEARTPRSENAKAIAEVAKGVEQVEQFKKQRGSSGAVFDVNPYDLWLEAGWNVRNFDTPQRKANIAELARSIGAVGVKENLLAYIKDDKIFIYQGWNRLLATYHAIEHGAQIKNIPVRLARASDNDADFMLSQLVNNGVRSDLTPFEKGIVIKRMVNFGWQMPDIAASIGKSVTNVKGLLDLQGLPMPLQELVANGTVSAYHATKAYRESEENGEEALRRLHVAIDNAKKQGASRVMPKHGEDAPPRRPRSSGRRRTTGSGGGEQPAPPAQTSDAIPRLIALIQAARWEKDEEANTALASFTLDEFNEIAVLADLPEDFVGVPPVDPEPIEIAED